ncbi:MAG: prepilin-type N-terminal cleavage/methylation domain-containing protein [Lachnospiraceae bacterium]|nr:prepilin-type N-terminal cleavage/methylation domain-containing protein [Lachnospiraceae bacterium]
MEKKSDHGFSLVELIIVIGIMAILVAVMTPMLLKYIEKTNVSSDTQLADSVRQAFVAATTDARVLSDSASEPYFEKLESEDGMNVDSDSSFLGSKCIMRESVGDILGVPLNTLVDNMRSKHAPDTHVNVKLVNGQVVVTLTGTDITGKKDTSSSTPDNDIVVK